MEAKVKISTIIPVYNGERYLRECLDSVISQSMNEIEVLIIDDGSQDGSWEIITEYTTRHSFVHGFQQSRKRQGAARNLGLQHAQGEYISFVDADDLIPSNAYGAMYGLASVNRSEVVTGIKKSFSDTGSWSSRPNSAWVTIPEHEKYFTQTMPKLSLQELPELLVDISVCNKLIRRSFIETHQIRFVENSAGEDIDFMVRLYLLAERISVLPEVVYHYYSRPNSRTGRIDPAFFKNRVSITLGLKPKFQQANSIALFSLLVLSEGRKLVGNRLKRVIHNSAYLNQIEIFESITALLRDLTASEITNARISISPVSQVRLLMLFYAEYTPLIALTTEPESKRYVSLIKNETAKSDLLIPLVSLVQADKSTTTNLLSVFSSAAQTVQGLAKLFKQYFAKLFGNSSQKALAYAYYFLLQPYVYIYSKFNSNENLWLIDERLSTSAEDNSYFFFKYLRDNHKSLKVFYVIDANSADRSRVAPLGNIVSLYSFKHAWLLSQASVLISTDRFTSLAYPYNIFPGLRRNTHNVFMQHGVAGNKTMTYSRRNYPYFSQVVVSNEIEQGFFIKHYCFSSNQISVTGIARFDQLHFVRETPKKRKVLIAPTWRKWLRDTKRIAASQYLHAWNELMADPELDAFAQEHDIEIYFRPHFNMIDFISKFETDSSHIKILTESDIFMQKYIKECDLLITDYSSVMYDFFYQDKPTICYMFDRREWELQSPGPPHYSFDEDLPADVLTSKEQVIESLKWHFNNNFNMRDDYAPRTQKLFKHRDKKNCQRIYQSILKMSEVDLKTQS